MTDTEREKAILENRRGAVVVSEDLIEVYPEILEEIERRVMVGEVIRDNVLPSLPKRIFRGVSPEFEAVQEGAYPYPHYWIVCELRGSSMSFRFEGSKARYIKGARQ